MNQLAVMEDLSLDELADALTEAEQVRSGANKAIFEARREITRRALDRGASLLVAEHWDISIEAPVSYAWDAARFSDLCRRSHVEPESAMTFEEPRPGSWKVNTQKALALGRKLGIEFAAALEDCYTRIPGDPTIKIKAKE